jgi:hypothetical protein
MLPPLIRCPRRSAEPRSSERGFTMAFVAITIVTLISMAALSIDIGTLYEASAEAQRAADAAALAAAQVISISGITSDPTNTSLSWQPACGGPSSLATLAATNVAQEQLNWIGGASAGTVTVDYGAGSSPGSNTSCVGITNFGVNPTVSVNVKRANLPVYFARIFSLFGSKYSGTSVSATATAEAFNPSGSSPMIPVQPRCVKPWMVPNKDPRNGTCTGATCPSFVDATSGAITHGGVTPTGVIDETFNLVADCTNLHRHRCQLNPGSPAVISANTLQYVPAQTSNASVAIAANTSINGCSQTAEDTNYWNAVAGCDQTTVYACGSSLTNTVNLTSDNPGPPVNDSVNAAQCLINAGNFGDNQGQDVLAPSTYPFQINAGANSAQVTAGGIASGSQITSSPSVVSLPIYDSTTAINPAGTTPVTVIGFLQVFINSVNSINGDINVTVMNVAGCGNGATAQAVYGTSPVPVRLITPP